MLRSESCRLDDIPGSWPAILYRLFAKFIAIFLCGAQWVSAQLLVSFYKIVVMLRCRAFSHCVGSGHTIYGSSDYLQSGRRFLIVRVV